MKSLRSVRSLEWQLAPDIQGEIKRIIADLKFIYLRPERIFCFRSFGSKSKARARIWSLPRIWQQALKIQPAYCLEILSERFDKLAADERKRTLIHELLHIPKNFSGALVPHRRLGKMRFEEKVRKLFSQVKI